MAINAPTGTPSPRQRSPAAGIASRAPDGVAGAMLARSSTLDPRPAPSSRELGSYEDMPSFWPRPTTSPPTAPHRHRTQTRAHQAGSLSGGAPLEDNAAHADCGAT